MQKKLNWKSRERMVKMTFLYTYSEGGVNYSGVLYLQFLASLASAVRCRIVWSRLIDVVQVNCSSFASPPLALRASDLHQLMPPFSVRKLLPFFVKDELTQSRSHCAVADARPSTCRNRSTIIQQLKLVAFPFYKRSLTHFRLGMH
jgi:hypothetical protein